MSTGMRPVPDADDSNLVGTGRLLREHGNPKIRPRFSNPRTNVRGWLCADGVWMEDVVLQRIAIAFAAGVVSTCIWHEEGGTIAKPQSLNYGRDSQ